MKMSWHQQPHTVNTSSSGGEWSDFQSGPDPNALHTAPGGANPHPSSQQWFTPQYGGGGGNVVSNQMSGYHTQAGVHASYGMGMGPQQMHGMGTGPQQMHGMGMGSQQVPGMGMGTQQVPGIGTGPQQMHGMGMGLQQGHGMGMGPQQVAGMGTGPQAHGMGTGPQQIHGMGTQQVAGMGTGPQAHGMGMGPQQVPGTGPQQIHGMGTGPQQVPATETPEQQRIRLEKEQEMKRQDEIRKRKLANIKISGGGKLDTSSIAIESLIGFDPKATTVKATPPASRATPPTMMRQEQPSSQPVVTINSSPTPPAPAAAIKPPHPKPQPSVTSYEDMLSGTLLDLSKTVSNTVKSTDFRRTTNPSSAATSTQHQHKIEFTESNKARQWGGANNGNTGSDFEGLFAQHAPPTQHMPPTQLINAEDDGFGDFQGGDQVQGGPHPSQGLYNVLSGGPSPMPPHGHSPIPHGPSPIPPQGHSPIPPQGHSPIPPNGPSSIPLHRPSPIPPHVTHPQAQSPQVVHTSSFNNPVMMTTPTINLPHWITARNYFLPSIYTDVIKKCSQGDDSDLMNTSVLFPILSSSGVDRAVLRDMWSEVNKTVPGTLTRNELVSLLAMIGVLQGSNDKESVSVSDLSSLSVPPSVTLSLTESQAQQPQKKDISSEAPSVSHTSSDNDPYAAFKSLVPSSDTTSSDHAPSHGPLISTSSSSEIDPSDPYSAFKVLTSSSTDTISATPTNIQPAPPTSNKSASSTNVSNSNLVSDWSDFTGQPRPQTSDQSDVFGEFSAGVMTSSGSNHGNWADFNSHASTVAPPTSNQAPPTVTNINDDSFGDFTGGGDPLPMNAPIIGTTPLIPSATPLIPSATPLIPSTTPLMDSTPLVPSKATSLMDPTSNATPSETSAPSPSLEYKVKAVEHFEVWRSCLTKCDELLEECVSVLCEDSVDQSLLEEISAYPGTLDRLLGVVEVYRFAERIHFTSRGPGRKHMTPEKSQSLMTVMMGIKKKWNKLCNTMPNNKMANLLKSSSSSPTPSSTHSTDEKCCLCLLSSNISISSLFTIDGYNEHYTLPTVTTDTSTGTSSGRVFHVQCMEFWTKGAKRHLAAIP